MIEWMTSRERVLRAAKHLPVDRVPIDLGCHFSTGISAFAYRHLREYLGLSADHIEMIDCTQLLARVDTDLLDRFHIDTVLLNPPFAQTYVWNPREDYRFHVPQTFQPMQQPDGAWKLELGYATSYMPKGGYFFDGAWPDYYNLGAEDRLRLFQRRAETLFKETDKFTLYMGGFGGFFHGLNFACDMLTDPDDCIALNEKRLVEQIERFDLFNAAAGRFVQAIEINCDLGMQSGPMCTPQSYHDLCFPYLQRFCKHVHETSDLLIFLHSCGSIISLLPDICEAGVDIINPVQVSATGMDPRLLKDTFGKKVCFWGGGCDTQNVLWKTTPQEVATHVRDMMAVFKPGSGFVFNQVHNILGNVPPENIVAMLDAAYEASFMA